MTADCMFGEVGDDEVKERKHILSPEAHTLFRVLLETNAARLDKETREVRKDETFRSFLLPINALTNKEIGSVGKDVGCPVCSKPTKSRCTRCHSISYCGAGALFRLYVISCTN